MRKNRLFLILSLLAIAAMVLGACTTAEEPVVEAVSYTHLTLPTN